MLTLDRVVLAIWLLLLPIAAVVAQPAAAQDQDSSARLPSAPAALAAPAEAEPPVEGVPKDGQPASPVVLEPAPVEAPAPEAAAPVAVASAAPVPAPPPPASPVVEQPGEANSADDPPIEQTDDDDDDALPSPAVGQGHFMSFGVHGVGLMAHDSGRGTRPASFGTGYTFHLGEAVTEWFDLSLLLALAFTSGDDSLIAGRMMVHSRLKLDARWFVHFAFGGGGSGGEDPADPDFDRGAYGAVYSGGIGYNLPLSNADRTGGWILTPVLTADVAPDSEFTEMGLWLGVEISWWSGLPRNQLDLPFDKAYDSNRR